MSGIASVPLTLFYPRGRSQMRTNTGSLAALLQPGFLFAASCAQCSGQEAGLDHKTRSPSFPNQTKRKNRREKQQPCYPCSKHQLRTMFPQEDKVDLQTNRRHGSAD
jgi:hypothetical protein